MSNSHTCSNMRASNKDHTLVGVSKKSLPHSVVTQIVYRVFSVMCHILNGDDIHV